MINEIFKPGIIGKDVCCGLLGLLNGVKIETLVPFFMRLANITSIYKQKNSRKNLENDRGIFVLTVIRMIMDRLLYEDLYPEIEENMSNSNIGALKNKNVRNHLFIVHGIINSVINGKAKCVDIQIYDIKQAFDALWIQDCMNDLFDVVPCTGRNNKLSLLYKANTENYVSVKTPVGQTDRRNIPEIVMQGSTWGPLECSNSLDKIGKICEENREHLFNYKNMVKVPILTMVDDTFAIAECGQKSVAINQYINTQIETKKLQMHTQDATGRTKCHKIHVGCRNLVCPDLLVHGTPMKEVSEDTYLGDIIRSDGKNTSSIKNRVSRGIGSSSQILNILETVSFGKSYFRIAICLREAMFLSTVLTNIEVWYGLSKSEIEELEILDRVLLRHILGLPSSTPTEFLYLETGCLNIGTILKMRRVNYLHYLLQSDEDKMLSQFFKTQYNFPVKDDWTEQVKQDLEDFELSSSLGWIKSHSKNKFKKLVKKQGREYALNQFMKKKGKHSKLDNLTYNNLKTQNHLQRTDCTVKQARILMLYRARMANYGNNYQQTEDSLECKLCGNHPDLQEDIYECEFNKDNIRLNGSYYDMFEEKVNIDVIQTLEKIYNQRENKLS